MNRQDLHNKLYYWILLALSVCIPIYDRLVVFLIAFLLLNWMVEASFKEKWNRLVNSKSRLWLLSFSVLYLLYCIGLFYSHNLKYGLFDIQVKLSLLIFPLIFSTIAEDVFSTLKIRNYFLAYLTGCVLITLYMLGHSLANYTHSNSLVEFYYDRLSSFQHPSYLSMNLNFAIALIIILLVRNWSEMRTWLRNFLIFLIPFFFLIIILLSSKAGIVSLLMIMVVSMASLIIYKREYLMGLLFLFLVPFVFIGASYVFPNSFYRLIVARDYVSGDIPLDASSDDGTNERLLVWKSSLEIIKEHPFCGVGTGDVKDVLLQKYQENHITAAVNKRLNAHNQYLQTLIALGSVGLIFLSLFLLIPAIGAIRHRDLLYFLFLLIVGINFLGESMLERQAGVVFYSFFNAFLFVKQGLMKAEARSKKTEVNDFMPT